MLIPLVTVLRQGFIDDPFQLHRQTRPPGRNRFRLLMTDPVQDRLLTLSLKRQATRHHLVEHHSQRPKVGAAICLLSHCLFGGHIRGRTQDGGRLGELRSLGELCEAEVHDLDLALRRHHQVGAFDVTMDDALVVGGLQALGGLDRNVQCLVELERTVGDLILHRVAFEVGHGEECLSLGLVDLVNRADVGVVELCRRFGFALETLPALFVAQQMRRQEFERHGPIEFRIFGLVNNTHPTFAELLGDLVVRDGRADHDGSILALHEL